MVPADPAHGDVERVPVEGVEPVSTGSQGLDAVYGFVNESESRTRRETVLLRATLSLLGPSRRLLAAGAVLAIVQLVALAGVPVAFVLAALAVETPGAAVLAVVAATLMYVAVVYLVVVPIRQVLFAAAVAHGLDQTGARRPSRRLLPEAVQAWSSLGRRGFASAFGRVGAVYEALMVFVVPIRAAEEISHKDAQRRSEELVATLWGPGRFRAVGLPRMGPQFALYTWVVLRFGYAAGQLSSLSSR